MAVSFRVAVSAFGAAPPFGANSPGAGTWEGVGYDTAPALGGNASGGALQVWSEYQGGASTFEGAFSDPAISSITKTTGGTLTNLNGNEQSEGTLTLEDALLGKAVDVWIKNPISPSFADLRAISLPPALASIYIAKTPGVENSFTFRVLARNGSPIRATPNVDSHPALSLQINIGGQVSTHNGTPGGFTTNRNGYAEGFEGWELIGARFVLPSYSSVVGADRTIKVRVIDTLGRYSPWALVSCVPNASANAVWDQTQPFLNIDLADSWDLDGVITTRTIYVGTIGAVNFEMTSPTTARIAEADLSGVDTSDSFTCYHYVTDDGALQGFAIFTAPGKPQTIRRLFQINGNANTVFQCAPVDSTQTRLARFDGGASAPFPVDLRNFGRVAIPALAPQLGHRAAKGRKAAGKGSGPLYVASLESDSVSLWSGVILVSGASIWTPLANMWTSTPHSFHFILLAGGAAASLAVRTVDNVRGLYFKRTSNLATWPPDENAVLVSTSITNSDEFELRSINGMLEAWNSSGPKFRAMKGGNTPDDWIPA